MRTTVRLIAMPALLIGVFTLPAAAVPAGTGTLRIECSPPTCCALYTYADATFDVFGTPVNLGTSVGEMLAPGTTTTPITLMSGLFDGPAESVPPGLLGVHSSGNYLCTTSDCMEAVSFVGSITNITGSVELPTGIAYTQDGSVVFVGGIPSPTIPGCTLGPVGAYDGTFGINAFQPQATPAGTAVNVAVSTAFFDSVTNSQVDVVLEVTFGEVLTPGTTTVTAFSNAAGDVPGNFAAEVRGQCVDEPATSCCIDTDCPTGTCTGCYRAAYVDVTTTAVLVPPIEICSFYQDADNDGIVDGSNVPEASLRFLHDEGGTFVDRTSSQDVVANVICAEVSSLSFFLVAAETGPCPAQLDDGCLDGFGKAGLKVRDVAGKERLQAKWTKGPELLQTDLGSPIDGGTGTVVSLCIYDQADSLAGVLSVDRAGEDCDGKPCWKSIGAAPPAGKGYAFKDKTSASDGVHKLFIKAGTAGKSKANLKAKGASIPTGIAAALQSSTSATIQLRASDGVCLSHTLTEVKEATADTFKAK